MRPCATKRPTIPDQVSAFIAEVSNDLSHQHQSPKLSALLADYSCWRVCSIIYVSRYECKKRAKTAASERELPSACAVLCILLLARSPIHLCMSTTSDGLEYHPAIGSWTARSSSLQGFRVDRAIAGGASSTMQHRSGCRSGPATCQKRT